jgi:hypothetical protein
MQEYTIDFSLQAFPTLDFVSFILPNLDTPLRFLAPILAIVLQYKFKVLQQKVPLSHMHLDFLLAIYLSFFIIS